MHPKHAVRPSGVRAEPNVTPMIDVMLVLLIIFMAVGPLLETGFRAEPPSARHAADRPDDGRDMIIGVDAAGGLFLDKQAVDSTALRARLRQRFLARPDDRVVYLRADRSLPYARVEAVMSLASAAGAHVVGLISAEQARETPAPR